MGATEGETGAATDRAMGKKKKRKQAAAEDAVVVQGVTFPQREHEVYMRRAELSFSFPFQAKETKAGSGGQERRAVFVLTQKALKEAIAELPGFCLPVDGVV